MPDAAERARGTTVYDEDDESLHRVLAVPSHRRFWAVFRALERGWTVPRLHEVSRIDPWFLAQFAADRRAGAVGRAGRRARDVARAVARPSSAPGSATGELAALLDVHEEEVRARRAELGLVAAYKRVDTCAAEFESFTPYLYCTYEPECEAEPTDRRKVVILGSGPNRIGQGIEFDYCCCHAAFALRDEGIETIMINCNPETVSTDYDTSDRLYFEPLTFEDVSAIVAREASAGGEVAWSIQFGGQTPLKLALPLQRGGRHDPRHLARLDRPRRGPHSASRSCCGSWASRRRRAARPPRARRPARSPSRSASRCSCGRPTCWAGARWRSCTTRPASTAT